MHSCFIRTRSCHSCLSIFRYGPASFAPDATGLGTGFGVHSVNEHFTADARLVDFYSHLIRLVDADREL